LIWELGGEVRSHGISHAWIGSDSKESHWNPLPKRFTVPFERTCSVARPFKLERPASLLHRFRLVCGVVTPRFTCSKVTSFPSKPKDCGATVGLKAEAQVGPLALAPEGTQKRRMRSFHDTTPHGRCMAWGGCRRKRRMALYLAGKPDRRGIHCSEREKEAYQKAEPRPRWHVVLVAKKTGHKRYPT